MSEDVTDPRIDHLKAVVADLRLSKQSLTDQLHDARRVALAKELKLSSTVSELKDKLTASESARRHLQSLQGSGTDGVHDTAAIASAQRAAKDANALLASERDVRRVLEQEKLRLTDALASASRRITASESSNAALHAQLEAASFQLDRQAADMASNTAVIDSLCASVRSSMDTALTTFETAHTAKMRHLDTAIEECMDVAAVLRVPRASPPRNDALMSPLRRALRDKHSEVDELQHSLSEALGMLEEVTGAFTAFRTEHTAEAEVLRTTSNAAAAAVDGLEREALKWKADAEAMQARAVGLDHECEKLRAEATAAELRLQSLSGELKGLRTAAEERHVRFDRDRLRFEEDVARLQKVADERVRVAEAAYARLEAATAAAAAVSGKDVASSEARVVELTQRLAVETQAREAALVQVHELTRGADASLADYRAERLESAKRVQALEGRVRDLLRERDERQLRSESAEEAARDAAASHVHELGLLSVRLEGAERDAERARTAAAAAAAEAEEADQRSMDLQRRLKAAESALSASAGAVQGAEGDRSAIVSELAAATARIVTLEAAVDHHARRTRELEAECTLLTDKLTDVSREVVTVARAEMDNWRNGRRLGDTTSRASSLRGTAGALVPVTRSNRWRGVPGGVAGDESTGSVDRSGGVFTEREREREGGDGYIGGRHGYTSHTAAATTTTTGGGGGGGGRYERSPYKYVGPRRGSSIDSSMPAPPGAAAAAAAAGGAWGRGDVGDRGGSGIDGTLATLSRSGSGARPLQRWPSAQLTRADAPDSGRASPMLSDRPSGLTSQPSDRLQTAYLQIAQLEKETETLQQALKAAEAARADATSRLAVAAREAMSGRGLSDECERLRDRVRYLEERAVELEAEVAKGRAMAAKLSTDLRSEHVRAVELEGYTVRLAATVASSAARAAKAERDALLATSASPSRTECADGDPADPLATPRGAHAMEGGTSSLAGSMRTPPPAGGVWAARVVGDALTGLHNDMVALRRQVAVVRAADADALSAMADAINALANGSSLPPADAAALAQLLTSPRVKGIIARGGDDGVDGAKETRAWAQRGMASV